MNFQMLDVLRHSGDRRLWDFRVLPSFAESYESHGNSISFLIGCTADFLPTNCAHDDIVGVLVPPPGAWCEMKAYLRSILESGASRCSQAALRWGRRSMYENMVNWFGKHWGLRYTHAWHLIQWSWMRLVKVWNSLPPEAKVAGIAALIWGAGCLYRSRWHQPRTTFDGQEDIAFCAHCSPQLMDEDRMIVGDAYEKRFHVPAACPRCSYFWVWKGWCKTRMCIGRSQYQFYGTYTALRMQRERDVHCPAVNQLDIPNEYCFAHRFLQLHGGTLGLLESKQRWLWSSHTRSYCLASQWEEIPGGSAPSYTGPRPPPMRPPTAPTVPSVSPPPPPGPPPLPPPVAPPSGATAAVGPGIAPGLGTTLLTTPIQRMRALWQHLYDNNGAYPQSTMLSCPYDRCRELIGRRAELLTGTTSAFRMGMLGIGGRVLDARYMAPPPEAEMVPVSLDSAQAVGPVTQAATVHNAQDRVSVAAVLEGRSTVKKSVFPDANGDFPDLSFKKSSKAAQRLNKFWKKFNQVCLTDQAIDRAYHKLFANKTFKEIAMSKFTQEDIEKIQVELQANAGPERIGTRKANGKLESVLKSGKPGRLVVDNTLQLLAVNIISTTIYQHILFDEEDGIFYDMSIKHRDREEVLNDFGDMMKDPWGDRGVAAAERVAEKLASAKSFSVPKKPRNTGKPPRSSTPIETCAWEIDQTGMELHERCNRHGEGLLGYTYNALMRINNRVSHKVNGEFTGLHEAKIVYDVKSGMRIRFRIKSPDVPKETWFTAKFADMYLDSGWALTSGVNFSNELSGVFSSITENPEHLFAFNKHTGKFRLQDGTFDWKFKSIPLYQTLASQAPSSFDIHLRGLFEGDDGGGSGSQCLADERNGGKHGLIIREQEDLGYSAKLKTIINGRVEIIGAHFPVRNGFVCDDVPWIPAVQRYTSKLGIQTNVCITPSSKAARFLSLASMFAGRNEPLQRGFELSAMRIIEQHGKEKDFWSSKINTDGYHEIDRAFGNGLHCTYTMDDVKAHYDRCANKVHQTSQTQIRMLNMSLAEDVDANLFTRDDYAKLGMFAEECRHFDGDHESAYSFLPPCLR